MNRIIFLILIISLASSCRTQKDVLYFQNLGQVINNSPEVYEEPKIQTGDALSIIVSTFNKELAEPFNLSVSGGGNTTATNSKSPTAYIVSQDGYVQIPTLGRVKVEGKTRQELATYLEGKISIYVENPIVNVRFLNYRVTMLGEFSSPGVIEAESDKFSIMEAIAQAGDMTLYSIRDSVMLIRTEEGVRTHTFINLKDANLINSPYFYLKQNDIVYAMPTKSKAIEFNSRPIRDGLTVLGFFLTIYALFK